MKLIKLYNTSTYGLVGGLRLKRKDNIIKRISSLFANYIRNLVLKDNCRDTGCSLKIFNKTIFMKIPYFDGIHRFYLLYSKLTDVLLLLFQSIIGIENLVLQIMVYF